MNKKTRIQWVDFARAVAIMCVVLCHATENVYQLNADFISSISIQSKIFVFAAFTCGRLGVPIFLFITGYLLLERTYGKNGCYSFWKKNLLGLVISVEIWILLYNIFLFWFNKSFSLTLLIKNMLFLQNVGLSHMWYIPMIIGLYVFLPFVADMLHQNDIRSLKFPMGIMWIYLFVVPVVNTILLSCGYQNIGNILSLDFGGGVYGFYLLCGYLVRKGVLKRIGHIYLIILSVITFVSTVMIQIFSYNHQYAHTVWYNNALLFLCAISLFELLSRSPFRNLSRIICDLSKCSFGIYLIHNPILMILKKNIVLNSILPIKVMLLFLYTFLISWLLVHVIGNISRGGKIIFYMR